MPTRETEINAGVGPAAKQVAEHASSLARLELELAILELKKKVAGSGSGSASERCCSSSSGSASPSRRSQRHSRRRFRPGWRC